MNGYKDVLVLFFGLMGMMNWKMQTGLRRFVIALLCAFLALLAVLS